MYARYERLVKRNKKKLEEVRKQFNDLEVGQHLKINHKDDMATRENGSRWMEINCHDAEIIYKNNHYITVKEPNGKRQSISFNQILSKAVTIQKGA